MLLIADTIKTVFARVFILLLTIEILLLITVLIIYKFNTIQVSDDMKQTSKMVTITYRDLFVSYLRNKYILLIDDLLLIMQTYDGIDSWRQNPNNAGFFSTYTEDYITNNCAVFGGDISNITLYNQSWYDDLSTINDRLKGTWYNGNSITSLNQLAQNDIVSLTNLCVLNNLFSKTLLKHKRWSNFFSNTLEYYIFTFSDSFYYKYPISFNQYMIPNHWNDTTRPPNCQTSRGINEFEPKCRPFYYQSMADRSNIVINPPYKYASSSIYGSDICIKSKNHYIVNDIDTPSVLLCIGFNFNDVELYKSQISDTLGANKKIFILYSDGVDITAMFSSDYYPQEYVSYGQKLNINNNTENNFFEIYNQKTFDSYLMNNATNTDYSTKLQYLSSIYNDVYSYYNSTIFPSLTKMINSYTNSYNMNMNFDINITNYKTFNESQYYFNISSDYYYLDTNQSITFSNSIEEDFYLLPIPVSFDYVNNYNLTFSKKTSFYMLYTSTQFTKNENVNTFFSVIIFEILLNFCFLVAVNCLIWVLFGFIYYYFFNAFLAPLKDINNLYKELLFVKTTNDDFRINYNLNHIEDDDSSGLFYEIKSNPNSFSKYIEKKIEQWIQSIFNLTNYQEIYECILTLKVLKIIRCFTMISTKNIKLNFDLSSREAHIENIVDALFYIMYNISSNIIEDILVDSKLITDLMYNNFIYKINSSTTEEEIEAFYEDVASTIENAIRLKQDPRRVSKEHSMGLHFFGHNFMDNSSLRKSTQQTINLAKKEMKNVYIKLKENLQYRYCVYKMKLTEKKIHGKSSGNFIDIEYNSDDETEEQMDKDITNSKDNKAYCSDEEKVGFVPKKKHQKNKKLHNINISTKNTLYDQEVLDNKHYQTISNLITEFNRYFTFANEGSDNSFNFNSLKHIAAHITQAGLLLEISNETEGIQECIKAMEKMKNLMENLNSTGNLTKFAYLTIFSLFFERILFLLSSLSEKYEQRKTQFFIYLNLLDLGPVYDRQIRAIILQKLLDYLNKTGLEFMKQTKNTNFSEFFREGGYINTKIVRHKVRALLNMSKPYGKNILLLIDLNFPFAKESNFQEIIKDLVDKTKHYFYFSCFNHQKLYIFRNLENEGESNEESGEDDGFIKKNIPLVINDEDVVNLYVAASVKNSETSKKNEKSSTETENEEMASFANYIPDANNYLDFFNFINSYVKIENIFTKDLKSRFNYALKNTIKYHKFFDYPKNNNFVIIFTTIESEFIFDKEEVIEVSTSLYKNQYSFILCLLYEEKIFKEEKYRTKLEKYKKFIYSQIINGHLFIFKSLTILKYIINCVVPSTFKEFETILMSSFLESIKIEAPENYSKKTNSNIFHNDSEYQDIEDDSNDFT